MNSGWALPKIALLQLTEGNGEQLVFQWGPQLLLFYCAAFWLHQTYISLSQKSERTILSDQKKYWIQNQFDAFFVLSWACSEFSVIFLYGILDGVRQGIFQRVCELWKHRHSCARHHLYWQSVCGLRAANAIYSFQVVMMIVLFGREMLHSPEVMEAKEPLEWPEATKRERGKRKTCSNVARGCSQNELYGEKLFSTQ